MGSIEKVEELLDETEVRLNDLLLNGFQGIHSASLDQMDELIKRNHSFAYNLERLMRAYSQVAFYAETCRKKI